MAEERGIYIKDEYRTHATEGTHYLLVIGIDNYVHFKKLNKAVRDAIAVKDLLTKRYQFEEINTFTLFDEEATRENIIQKFRLLVGKLEPNDSLLIYYAGHGNYDEMLDMGYWIPVESEPSKTGAYLSNNDLILFINKMKGRHIFLVSDSCFSGTLLAEARDAYTDKVKDLPSRWALSSGRKELVLDDSPFVKSFLTYLEANKEQELLVQDLISYVERNTANNAAQTPFGNRLKSVGDQGGAFVFRLSAEAMLSHDQIAFAALQTRYEQFANAKHIDHEKYAALYQDLQTFALATQDSSLAVATNELKSTFSQLIEDKEWAETQRINTKKAYNDFIENHPHSKYFGEAEQKIEEIEDENAWKEAK